MEGAWPASKESLFAIGFPGPLFPFLADKRASVM